MDFVKKAIWGPDPKEQFRKCQSELRKNKRQLDRQIQDLNILEKKTKNLIKTALKKNDLKTAKLYAREYRNVVKSSERMNVSKATLDSIGMKLNEQQQMIKLKGSMVKSTEIMKQMNQLVSLPEMSRNVQELSKELVKSGIIDEMIDDIIDSTEMNYEEDEEEEAEQIQLVLNSILNESKEDTQPVAKVHEDDVSNLPEGISSPVMEAEDDDDEMLANMRQRLSALQE